MRNKVGSIFSSKEKKRKREWVYYSFMRRSKNTSFIKQLEVPNLNDLYSDYKIYL